MVIKVRNRSCQLTFLICELVVLPPSALQELGTYERGVHQHRVTSYSPDACTVSHVVSSSSWRKSNTRWCARVLSGGGSMLRSTLGTCASRNSTCANRSIGHGHTPHQRRSNCERHQCQSTERNLCQIPARNERFLGAG